MRKLFVLAGLAATFIPSSAFAMNLIANGDFESGNTGFTSDYTFVLNTGDKAMWNEGTYTVTGLQPVKFHSSWRNELSMTGHGALYMMFNGATTSGKKAWSSTPTEQPLLAGIYRLRFDIATVYAPDQALANLEVRLGDSHVTTVQAPAGSAQWKTVDAYFTLAADLTGNAAILNLQTAASGNDFAIDNISLTSVPAVPEPFTMMIAGAGLALGIARRRRR